MCCLQATSSHPALSGVLNEEAGDTKRGPAVSISGSWQNPGAIEQLTVLPYASATHTLLFDVAFTTAWRGAGGACSCPQLANRGLAPVRCLAGELAASGGWAGSQSQAAWQQNPVRRALPPPTAWSVHGRRVPVPLL